MDETKVTPKKLGFSFEPELVGSGPDGTHVVIDANHYVMLHSITQGRIFYTAKDNKYWLAEGKECPKRTLDEKFLPYLRWKFDELEEEVVYGDRDDGKGKTLSKPIPTGRMISKFPPSPENITKKRDELLSALRAANETIDDKVINHIYNETRPQDLLNNETFEARLDKTPHWEKVIQKLNR